MAFQIPSEVRTVFGSQTRAKVLGYLAGSTTPRTGYAIAKSLGVSVSKVYDELKRLEAAGILGQSLDSKGRRRFLLRDPDLRSFLVKRVRISSTEDWFSPERIAERRETFERAKETQPNLPRPPSGAKRDTRLAREFQRPPEKDRALARARRASRAGRPR